MKCGAVGCRCFAVRPGPTADTGWCEIHSPTRPVEKLADDGKYAWFQVFVQGKQPSKERSLVNDTLRSAFGE